MNSPRPRPFSSLLLVLAAVAAVVLGLVTPASAAAPYCGITWGSQLKAHGGLSSDGVAITGVRSGHHDCYDRMVVDVNPAVTGLGGYRVEYVDRIFSDPKGEQLSVRGGAILQVTVYAPNQVNGQVTYLPQNQREVVNVTGYRTFRQVVWAGSSEGVTTLGVGTRARLPFRVFVLPGSPSRMVIDVAHRW
ncbi:hypothetical protein SAMN05661080_01519 [Modestobacter sp. DSM 44400]|uniref:AMIN-like domain-containing (lipo)protein n=1 Tax=Modestobacter sp. DSM 44400 TaxID=1550230 RepID=UPI00089A06E5|nr:hypothetical protein [Modestobacter sp. DSM 44400]SDX87151.1 hypothetical protein SAMN05661080_01519 [Modestobacter sp. DSM 44400]